MSDFTDKIKVLKKFGITPATIARESNVNLQRLYRYEQGQTTAFTPDELTGIDETIRSLAIQVQCSLETELALIASKREQITGIL